MGGGIEIERKDAQTVKACCESTYIVIKQQREGRRVARVSPGRRVARD